MAGYISFALSYHPHFITATPVASRLISADPLAFLKQQVPAYSRSSLGKALFPLSLAFVTNNGTCLKQAFLAAGWQSRTLFSYAHLPAMFQGKGQAADLPLPPLFWNNRLYTQAFVTTVSTAQGDRTLAVFLWETPYHTPDGQLFTGVAEAFSGLRWGLLRQLDPDLDQARNEAVASLRTAGYAARVTETELVPPYVGENLLGQHFFGRGKLDLIVLGNCLSESDTARH